MGERMPCHITDGPDQEDGPLGGLREPPEDETMERHKMLHDEFNDAMTAVMLSESDMAKLTGVYPWSVRRWVTGRSPVPDYAWTIVRDRKKIRELTLELCK